MPDPSDAESVESFCRHLAAAERELTDRYIDTIHDTLDKVVRSSQALQLKKLQAFHDRRVAESKKKIEVELKESNRCLDRRTASKDEISRLRREMSQVIIKDGVQHRERLTAQLEQAKESLSQQQKQVRQQAQDRRQTARRKLDTEQVVRATQLAAEWLYSSPEATSA